MEADISILYEYRARRGGSMTQELYGTELAKYKLDRAREELDTAKLLYDNERLKAANNIKIYNQSQKGHIISFRDGIPLFLT